MLGSFILYFTLLEVCFSANATVKGSDAHVRVYYM